MKTKDVLFYIGIAGVMAWAVVSSVIILGGMR